MKNNQEKIFYGTIIDKNVGIIALNSHKRLHELSQLLKGRINKKIYIICGIWWSCESVSQVLQTVYIIWKNKLLYPNIEVSILCNTEKERYMLNKMGVDAIFCNHNCFIDENIFNINNYTKKKYTAVYNAVLKEFKRHILCKEIKNLALITYNFSNIHYKEFIDKNLNNPVWINYLNNETPLFLNDFELSKVYNESNVGLALSTKEGAMYASNEYLLCGLPVVSTKSKGGRDVFYTENNCRIVEPNPLEVKNAVEKFNSNPIDPYKIRRDVLNEMQQHRNRFIEHVDSIINKNNMSYSISETWNTWFIHKLRNELTVNKIVTELKKNC